MTFRLMCLIGSHAPKRSRARFDGNVFRAPCRGCGRPLVRLEDGWVLAEQFDDDPATSELHETHWTG